MLLALPILLSAAESESSGPNHWAVGAGVLILLIVMLVGLLAFGGGRDHT
jgi:hypothetical protein